jgi:hypothetical protein
VQQSGACEPELKGAILGEKLAPVDRGLAGSKQGVPDESLTMRVDVHVDGKQDLWMTRNTGLATSTPANSDQNWVPSKEFRGVSTIKVTRPAPVAREQGIPLG